MTAKKAIGQRGSWFANVDGKELPCVHKHWLKGLAYHDPFKPLVNGPSPAKIHEYVQAIQREKQVVLTNDAVLCDPQGMVKGFTRQNYIAVFAVENVKFDPSTGLKFTITSRLSDLQ
ncbi:hypothetical protein QN219_04980 [Sinorhizobium sp. 7-81]|uniref:hypothetical protein n=1 Tax=Sinorhizobium sp. 8-89 TaxID=3049089 RepID=UPI0024C2565A|nr:hypothetical protein [Sinorhizobium sp. 8-89]MDK1489410.1 hypothetical protein [Sinorhizobium sp. 8-89]